MKKVFKYALDKTVTVINMPLGADVLQVHAQGGPVYEEVYLWALVDTDAPCTVERTFEVVGTGHPIASVPLKYCGTAHLRAGTLVLHVFELVKESP